MSLKNSFTTSDRLEWDVATNLVRKLYRDGDYRMSLLIGCGIFFGLRISDIKQLTWDMLLKDDKFILTEKKTGKRREVKINKLFQEHIHDCFEALKADKTEYCFTSRKKKIISTQRINVVLKQIKSKYNLKIDNFSTHTMRKTFGYRVYSNAGDNSELALVKLMELFNHSNIAITKKYLGLRQEEINECYDLLSF